MSKQARSYFQRPLPYRRRTLRPLNSLLWILPMLAVFHVFDLLWNADLLGGELLHRALTAVGLAATWAPAIVVIAVLLGLHIARRDPWELQGLTLVGMILESAAGILPLIALGVLTDKVWPPVALLAGVDSPVLAQRVVAGVGAAVYEEFLFRLILIGLVLAIFANLLRLDRYVVGTVAVLISAAAFSLGHFRWAELSPAIFPWRDFIFRALVGVYLGVVFVTRGLGVTCGVHAFWNIYFFLYHPPQA